MPISDRAGQAADPSDLVDLTRLVSAYYTGEPDPADPAQRVAFGTSGHRGSSLSTSFNQAHIAAIVQAVCQYRAERGIDGPLFVGADTHALSLPAGATTLEVLAGNGVETMLAAGDEYTPTPAVSHAIIAANRGKTAHLADGIVITPSHNPPRDGGLKYNPPHGGPADTAVTGWIERRANELIADGLRGVERLPYARALRAATTHRHDFLSAYVADLGQVIDLDAIRAAKVRVGVDPLGGAGVHYWRPIAERLRLDLAVVDDQVDPTFRFMTLDWDGQIRMDPSSPYAMRRLIGLKDRFAVSVACDTDHDRHGIVARSAGLMQPNQYLAVAIAYLFGARRGWRADAGIGKTVVSTSLIDRVAAKLGRRLVEVPVGFKWFVDGLADGSLGFVGEESAGASFLRRDGTVWTTDKDGIIAALLAAEITAVRGKDPGEVYRELTAELGTPLSERSDAPATRAEKAVLAKLDAAQVRSTELAGGKITAILTAAPGNGAPIGGVKVMTADGWFAARPSGTEDIYKIYAESFRDADHLRRILAEAREVVAGALRGAR